MDSSMISFKTLYIFAFFTFGACQGSDVPSAEAGPPEGVASLAALK